MDMPRVISVKIGMQPPQNLVNAFHMSGVARKSKQQQYRDGGRSNFFLMVGGLSSYLVGRINPSMVEIGLTDQPKSGGACAPMPPPPVPPSLQ